VRSPASTQVPLDWTTTFPLEDGAEIFTAVMNGHDDDVKALLCP
jgi:hypothetical protein